MFAKQPLYMGNVRLARNSRAVQWYSLGYKHRLIVLFLINRDSRILNTYSKVYFTSDRRPPLGRLQSLFKFCYPDNRPGSVGG